MSDAAIYELESVLLMTLLTGYGLMYAVHRFGRTRPELQIRAPLVVAVVVRLIMIAGVSASGIALTLRGGDERLFLQRAHEIAASGFDSGLWWPADVRRLHEIVFALQIKLADFPEAAMRVTQVGIAMLGILLVVVTIHDLAGPRAARLGAWALALEPGAIFFNSILHREPLLVLASGLVVFGGAKIWTKLDLRGVLVLGLGCLIALGTRPYAAWFLMTGGLLLILHAALRQVFTRLRSIPLVYAVVMVMVAATPAVLALTSEKSLAENLQTSQEANTDPYAARGSANPTNLGLEEVDFSTRSNLLTNLPRRIRDVVLRPYPWQLGNTSQQLGAIGTLIVLAALFLLVRYARRTRGRIVAVAAPLLYPAGFLLIAYALSVGNAGTGFRYRTHLVLLGLATLVVLREHALVRASTASDRSLPSDAGHGPALGRVVPDRAAPVASRFSS